jgi:hypothetical protein
VAEVDLVQRRRAHHDFYCYVLFRLDGSPFYVGKGRRNRWLVHEKEAKHGRSHKDHIILQIKEQGRDVPKVKVAHGLSHDQAVSVEIAMIAAIGRGADGPLVNLTDGGDGMHDATGEIGRKISKAKTGVKTGPRPRDFVERQAAAFRGKKLPPMSERRREQNRKMMLEVWSTPEGRAKRADAGMKGRTHTEETKEKMREAALSRPPVSDASRAKMSATRRGKKASPGAIAARSKGLREYWSNTENRAKQSEAMKVARRRRAAQER